MSNILNLNCISVIQYPSISLVNYHIGGKLVPNLCCVLGCRVGDPDEVFLTRLFSNYVLYVVHISRHAAAGAESAAVTENFCSSRL